MQRTLYIICVLMLTLCGCDEIAYEDRFTVVNDIKITKNVLIEDFTGQDCLNCPNAAREIADIQSSYGKEHVIAVAIHGGNLAMHEDKTAVGLANNTGEEYHRHWNVEALPSGMVDRLGGIVDYPQWRGLAMNRLQKETGADISVAATLTPEKDAVVVKTTVLPKVTTDAKLQVWLTESNINRVQRMPDGTYNPNYTHNHVFRAAINGTWGEAVNLQEGDTLVFEHRIDVKSNWASGNLSVVAFVHNEMDGVLQVVESTID